MNYLKKINRYKYYIFVVSLLAVFWLMSLYAVSMNLLLFKNESIFTVVLYHFLNDFWTVFIIGLLFLPIYIISEFFGKRPLNIFLKTSFICIIIAQFSLIKYGLTTNVNLGTDLLGYSLADIKMTVSSSESFSLLYFLPYIILPTLFLSFYYLLNKRIKVNWASLKLLLFIFIFGIFKMILPEANQSKFQNKLYFLSADIIKLNKERFQNKNLLSDKRNDYPLLKPIDKTKDVLTPFFNLKKEKPTIVFLIVEGLGSEFVGDNLYAGFTPYLDSLIDKSLYWKNFLSTTSRSFGIMPALLGSLPYGEMGFLEIAPTPSHISLINVLKGNGYTTSFYAGHQSSFDRKINFLEYNGIDYIIDENKFGPGYVKTNGNEGGFSWGYSDSQIIKKTLVSLDNKKLPRLDIVRTQTNHEPFDFPAKSIYLKKVDSILTAVPSFKVAKSEIKQHSDIYAALLYTDDAVKNFIQGYSKRPEYSNTIFIITGDHRLVPVPQKDKLCKYHVPLYIYSPLLKKAEKFNSVSSHLDVAPSLLTFLMNNYKFNELEHVAWLGKGIDTARAFRNIHEIPLMRYKGKINDFLYKDYFYSDGELFKINEQFGTYKVYEKELLNEIKSKLEKFKNLNTYITQRNKIYPDSLNIFERPIISFSEEESVLIKKLVEGLNFDEIFLKARDIGFKKEFKKAKLLCNYILNEHPNHVDARTLRGKALAWEKRFKEAEFELLDVQKRNPYYSDVYLAILDLYWWSNQDSKAINIVKKAEKNEIFNIGISFKLAKAHQRMNNIERSKVLIDSILNIDPTNSEYLTFKQTLK